ncbi:hypothetical protein ACQR1W_08980 [Bradyrhizobium sp. HKCCYLS1011]|uniref:hypothetical protein n=1 Tax=Bradyrhizobium sp. HKCCYLS1011 TaxID=3420733 RepID=UPI003EBED8EE
MAKNKRRKGGKERIRQADPARDGLAYKMLNHFIPYEVGMMRALFERLSAGSPSQLQRNAEIEAFHIHARNLIEFFTNDKQCAIDPRTFADSSYTVNGNFIPKKLESKISQQIVHLTHERTDVEKDKLSDSERGETLRFIEAQIRRFEKALKPEWQQGWRDGLTRMNFSGPVGPNPRAQQTTGPTGPIRPVHFASTANLVAGATNHIEATSSQPTAGALFPERASDMPQKTEIRTDYDRDRSI